MRDLGLVEAWQLWLSGSSTADIRLWSVSMMWWARIGKLLQFAGALTIVLDLVKAERLKTWGKRMRGSPFSGNVKAWAAESAPMQVIAFVLAIVFVIWLESAFGAQLAWVERNTFGQLDVIPGWGFWLLIAFFAGLGYFTHKVPRDTGNTAIKLLRRSAVGVLGVGLGLLGLLFVVAFLLELGPYAFALGLMFGFWWLLLQVLDFGIARPVAWILDRSLPGQPLRWLGVALLILGFHFDLLAS